MRKQKKMKTEKIHAESVIRLIHLEASKADIQTPKT